MLYTILLQAAGSGAPAGSGTSMFGGMLLPLLLIFVIFYFFMIMPQQKKQKKLNAFRDNLKNGDKVVTIGGIYGRVREVKDNAVILEVADGVRIKFDKSAISMADSSEVITK